jgi:HD-GYP domain-containing protein (c-di-GMP phosphodiesterase class II)
MNDSSSLQDIQEFIRHMISAVAAASLYGMRHQQVIRLTEIAYTSISHALSTRPDIAILLVDGELIIDTERLPFSITSDKFAKCMQENRIGHLRIIAGVPKPDLNLFIAALTQQSGDDDLGSSDYIRVGRVEIFEAGVEPGSMDTGEDDIDTNNVSLRVLSELESARLAEVYEAVRRNEKLKPTGIAATVVGLVEAFKREGEAMLVLAALREHDEYNFTHAGNVCILAMAQATSLGIKGQLLNDIGIAAMLHDVGKMFLPEEILNKEEKLTEEEFAVIKMHPTKGGRYLLESPGIPRLAAIVAYEHHMYDDLSGYPSAPSGWKLNLASQITSIADVFDAMRSKRAYQKSYSPDEIANMILSKTGSKFNPLLVRNFLDIMSRLNKL